MKVIALKDFARVPELAQYQIDGEQHENHIHKGAVFEIGAGKDLKVMLRTEAPAAKLVAQLVVSGCVGDATDSKVVKAVQESVDADDKREVSATAANAAAAESHLKSITVKGK